MPIELADDNYRFQDAVREWCVEAFGVEVADNIATRCWRFFEEASELCQALGMTKADAEKLINYTWSRPVGEPHQEMGGAMVTLGALAGPAGLDMNACGNTELARCWENIDKIRAKQASKAKLGLGEGPLPGSAYLGKWVTLQMAVQVSGDWWLPQGLALEIVKDAYEGVPAWHLTSPQTATSVFAIPKDLCSAPRDVA